VDIQAFYCAEAEAARVYACYARAKTPAEELACQSPGQTPLTLANGSYVSRVSAEVIDRVVTVTATCDLPTGRNRTVQRNGKRAYPDPILRFAEAGAGADPVTGVQGIFGDMVLGVADSISGDIYVSGNVHLRGEGIVTGYGPPDPPAITVAPGKQVTITQPLVPPPSEVRPSTPLPVLSNAEGGGIIDKIRLAVTNKDGTPMMTGTYQNATVYNLGEIFVQLGATNEDLADTEQQLQDAQQDAEQAQKDADSAKQKAENTSDELDKAQAEAEQAKAEADAAGSKAKIAAECAKAYISAAGSLLGGEDRDAVQQTLQGITDECRAAFEAA